MFLQYLLQNWEWQIRNLTKNIQLPFTADEAIKNLSRYKLTEAETLILKFDLK